MVLPSTLKPQQPSYGAHRDADDAKTVSPFPAGALKRHEARAWGRSLDAVITARGLTSVARNKLPPGHFPKLWSDQALELPPAPRSNASYRDQLSFRSMCDEVEKRTSFNAQITEREGAAGAANALLLLVLLLAQRRQ